MKAAEKGFRFIEGENVNRGSFLYYVTQNVQEPFGLKNISLAALNTIHSWLVKLQSMQNRVAWPVIPK